MRQLEPARLAGPGGEAPPPRYEEVVSLHNRAPGGGILLVSADDEAGVVADGKMPISEMALEDVVLEDYTQLSSQGSASSASQRFAAIHHDGIGNTMGHTNC